MVGWMKGGAMESFLVEVSALPKPATATAAATEPASVEPVEHKSARSTPHPDAKPLSMKLGGELILRVPNLDRVEADRPKLVSVRILNEGAAVLRAEQVGLAEVTVWSPKGRLDWAVTVE